MILCCGKAQRTFASKITSIFISISFLLTSVAPSYAQSLSAGLPASNVLIASGGNFNPVLLRAIEIDPKNPLHFGFIVDSGDTKLAGGALSEEAKKLIRYFLAALTTPEKDMWVNLSPYEKDRIIEENFSQTQMGRDLLAQDYILKQLTASLIYPEDELGKKFWDKVYKAAYEKYGTTNIPMDTFNKIWILPKKATVYENNNRVFVVDSELAVMMEEDYLALQKSEKPQAQNTNSLTSQVVREIVLPAIEKEVNFGKNFASLRQVYGAMILATWYKNNLKESLLGQVYMDQNKIKGIDLVDKAEKQKIYDAYVNAFKKGIYDFIKVERDQYTGKNIPRKYFSGGFIPKTPEGVELNDAVVEVIPSAEELRENGTVTKFDANLTENRSAGSAVSSAVISRASSMESAAVLLKEITGKFEKVGKMLTSFSIVTTDGSSHGFSLSDAHANARLLPVIPHAKQVTMFFQDRSFLTFQKDAANYRWKITRFDGANFDFTDQGAKWDELGGSVKIPQIRTNMDLVDIKTQIVAENIDLRLTSDDIRQVEFYRSDKKSLTAELLPAMPKDTKEPLTLKIFIRDGYIILHREKKADHWQFVSQGMPLKGEGAVSSGIHVVSKEEIDLYVQKLGMDVPGSTFNRDYFTSLIAQYNQQMTDKQKGIVNDLVIGENFLPNSMIPKEKMKELMNSTDFGTEILSQENKYLEAAQNVDHRIDFMNGGAGTSVGGVGAKSMALTFVEDLQGFDAGGNPKTFKDVEFSILDVKYVHNIVAAQKGRIAQASIRELVSKDTVGPISEFRNKQICLLDKIDDRIPESKKRTYAEYIKGMQGISLGEDMIVQAIQPVVDVATGELTDRKTSPGGHGVFGRMAFEEILTDALPSDKVVIRDITNGDGPNNQIPSVVLGWMAAEKVPMVLLSSTTMELDKKGGKVGIQPVVNGLLPEELTADNTRINMMETVQAGKVGQGELFQKIGLTAGPIEDVGQEGEQFFNTNIMGINETVLQPFLRELEKIIGHEQYVQWTSPTFIDNPKENGTIYQIEGALGHVLQNLDYHVRYTDNQQVKDLMRKYGWTRLLHIVNFTPEYRELCFTPVKFALDWNYYLSEHFAMDTQEWAMKNNKPGHLARFEFSRSYEDYYQKNKGNAYKILPLGSKTLNLDLLYITGKWVLNKPEYIGTVELRNDTDQEINLDELLAKRKYQYFFDKGILKRGSDGHLILDNVVIVYTGIDIDGSGTDLLVAPTQSATTSSPTTSASSTVITIPATTGRAVAERLFKALGTYPMALSGKMPDGSIRSYIVSVNLSHSEELTETEYKDLVGMDKPKAGESVATRFYHGWSLTELPEEIYAWDNRAGGRSAVFLKLNKEQGVYVLDKTMGSAYEDLVTVSEGMSNAELLSTAETEINKYLNEKHEAKALTDEIYQKALKNTFKNLKEWATDPDIQRLSPNTAKAIYNAIRDERWAELVEAFYQDITFGTAGIRGKAALTFKELLLLKDQGPLAEILKGPNTINDIVLLQKTQGVINYAMDNDLHRIVIGYDSRINGQAYAEMIARTFIGAMKTTGYDFKIFLFDEASPFPELTYGITIEKVRGDIGILISASHNPADYNGYKITRYNGAQLNQETKNKVMEGVGKVKMPDIVVAESLKDAGEGHLFWLGGQEELQDKDYLGFPLIDMHSEYAKQLKSFFVRPEVVEQFGSRVNVGFAAFNGSGYKAVPRLLTETGFTNFKVVSALQELNGLFPAFKYGEQPDPGDPIAAAIAVNEFIKEHGEEAFDILEFVIGTDPDADRMGSVVKVPKDQQKYFGPYTLLSANDAWTLLLWYRLMSKAELGQLNDPENYYVTFSHVTTDALEAVGDHFGVRSLGEMLDKTGQEKRGNYLEGRRTWVGFTYIADFANQLREKGLINVGGFEESNGGSILGGPVAEGQVLGEGAHVNDKDGTLMAILMAELAAYCKSKNISPFEFLDEIYRQIGHFATANKPLPRVGSFKGAEGKTEKIKLLKKAQEWMKMANDPTQGLTIAGKKVIGAIEFKSGRYDPQHYEGFPDEGIRFFFEDANVKEGDVFTQSKNYITIRPSGTSETLRFYTQFFSRVAGQGEEFAKQKYDNYHMAEVVALEAQKQLLAEGGLEKYIPVVEDQLKIVEIRHQRITEDRSSSAIDPQARAIIKHAILHDLMITDKQFSKPLTEDFLHDVLDRLEATQVSYMVDTQSPGFQGLVKTLLREIRDEKSLLRIDRAAGTLNAYEVVMALKQKISHETWSVEFNDQSYLEHEAGFPEFFGNKNLESGERLIVKFWKKDRNSPLVQVIVDQEDAGATVAAVRFAWNDVKQNFDQVKDPGTAQQAFGIIEKIKPQAASSALSKVRFIETLNRVLQRAADAGYQYSVKATQSPIWPRYESGSYSQFLDAFDKRLPDGKNVLDYISAVDVVFTKGSETQNATIHFSRTGAHVYYRVNAPLVGKFGQLFADFHDWRTINRPSLAMNKAVVSSSINVDLSAETQIKILDLVQEIAKTVGKSAESITFLGETYTPGDFPFLKDQTLGEGEKVIVDLYSKGRGLHVTVERFSSAVMIDAQGNSQSDNFVGPYYQDNENALKVAQVLEDMVKASSGLISGDDHVIGYRASPSKLLNQIVEPQNPDLPQGHRVALEKPAYDFENGEPVNESYGDQGGKAGSSLSVGDEFKAQGAEALRKVADDRGLTPSKVEVSFSDNERMTFDVVKEGSLGRIWTHIDGSSDLISMKVIFPGLNDFTEITSLNPFNSAWKVTDIKSPASSSLTVDFPENSLHLVEFVDRFIKNYPIEGAVITGVISFRIGKIYDFSGESFRNYADQTLKTGEPFSFSFYLGENQGKKITVTLTQETEAKIAVDVEWEAIQPPGSDFRVPVDEQERQYIQKFAVWVLADMKEYMEEYFPKTSSGDQNLGGIDMSSSSLDLQIKRDGNGIPLPISEQPIETMNIQGFSFQIMGVTPVPSLFSLSGLEGSADKISLVN